MGVEEPMNQLKENLEHWKRLVSDDADQENDAGEKKGDATP